jgi:hypothetical protein
MVSKDSEKQLNIFDIPDSFIPEDMRIYYPSWDNIPPKEQTVIKFKETPLLSKGGILSLCAEPGVGKSSIMEAFISSHLNQNSDSLSVSILLNSERNKILFCDTERSQWESHKAWSKLMKRAGISQNSNDHKCLVFANLKALSINERKTFVNDFANQNKDLAIIVFDGGADFMNNTNDLDESNKFNDWINTFNPNISFMFTVHTNPSDNKPRGHFGSEICRRSQTVLLARRRGEIFEITTNFEHGKNRHGKHESWNYKYCQETDMFVSSSEEYIPIKANTKYKDLADKIWGDKDLMSFSEILKQIGVLMGKSYDSSKSIFFRQFKDKICIKIESDNMWKLI